ncbi:MAG: putative transporter [Alphaproteobacteria bacterium]|nr:putative transporter [Alphaproteobacteria bacterium]
MIKAYFQNRKWTIWAWGGGFALFLVIWTQVEMSVLLNTWYRDFYDLLQNAAERDVAEFWDSIFAMRFEWGTFFYVIPLPLPRTFMWIALPVVLTGTAGSFLVRHYGFRWRQAITEDYIPRWRNVEQEIEGASQRIQEDANRFARIVESLGLQVLRAVLTLIAFLPILWTLSGDVDLPIIRDIPGSLVWAALIVTVGGMTISWFVGYFLPGLEYNNQKVEAAFRKELVLGEDDKFNHAQPENLFQLFTGLRFNYFRLYLHYGYFDLWSNMYGQITALTPLLMIGPAMFTGAVSVGLLFQVTNAYGRVDGSFSIILDNWTTLTELRSIWKRLHEFEANLDKYNTGHDVGIAPEAAPAE